MAVSRWVRGPSLWLAGAAAACLLVVGYSAPAASAGTAAIQAPVSPSLLSVACTGGSDCVAVGTDEAKVPISQVWNGTSWSYVSVPAKGQALNGIACPSSGDCLAVGNLGAADQWNGTSWRATPTPYGARLRSVACVSKDLCLAVGQATYVKGDDGVIRWNGTAWTAMRAPRPAGARSASLVSIWCASAKYCLAVGSDTVSGKSQPIAESFNGSAWHLMAAPSIPVYGVACNAPRNCLAIGDNGSERWNGASWAQVATPSVGRLTSISCPSATSCLAINGTATLEYNGLSWATQAPPAAFAGGTALWCGSPADCEAVGSGGPAGSVAEHWNGTLWTGQRTVKQDSLVSVSCNSTSHCVALGSYISSRGVPSTMSMQFNGRTWALTSDLPAPVTEVSCTTFSFCMAEGNGPDAVGEALKWNGFTWSPTSPTGGTALGDVACTTKTFCMTIGWRGTTYSWNGNDWASQSGTSQVSGDDIFLSSVACASSSFCNTAGFYDLSDCTSCNQCSACSDTFAITEEWNGKSWDPNTSSAALAGGDISCPTTAFCLDVFGTTGWTWTKGNWKPLKGALPKGLTSVSCYSATACLATGDSLAERWDGATWKREPAPWAGGSVTQVSCLRQTPSQYRVWCLAVGTVNNETRAAYWYNGKWHQTATLNP